MNLTQLRAQIDKVDEQLLSLLNERTALAEEVGQIKRGSGQQVFAPEREEMLLQRLEKLNNGRLSKFALRAIYREILSASRQNQKQIKVAYLGPEATNTHQAALDRFGACDLYQPYRSIPDIFAAVRREEADMAVVPIENSIEGAVNATLDALVDSDLFVCGEIYLQIKHVLVSQTSDSPIEIIYSHPQALGQCRQWLIDHYPNAQQVEVSSTSEGAKRAKLELHAAAVTTSFAANFYGLTVRHRNIQDAARNQTRFLILSRHAVPPSKGDRTSVIFAVPHKVGALSAVLAILAERKLSLLKIESRPATGRFWEYLFFVDLEGHSEQQPLREALESVRSQTLWLKILGSYPQTNVNV